MPLQQWRISQISFLTLVPPRAGRIFRPRFPGLPLESYDEEILLKMGNSIGHAVKVDATILAASRGRYTRVCVELNLSKPLILAVTVLGGRRRIEYEGLHLICFECEEYGHRVDVCRRNTPAEQLVPLSSSLLLEHQCNSYRPQRKRR
ncbi:hypothetical protein M9H77_14357 [Catharanthus roseus]|uniref:Uncharacterized protein n=1 Tax=Catharanthus roseus TaxID=4058 RepID=A0ACC0BN23_CATRO|nr:hypothetical protein M9H77_14357 [Catharanthus roseus]